MTAFDVLRHEQRPVSPDRRFAEALRARIVAGLSPMIDLPERSSTMSHASSTTGTSPGDTSTTGAATGAGQLVPYLAVHHAAGAIDWYVDVLGGREVVRYVGDDGRIGHAEIDVGGARFYLSDEYPDHGVSAPPTLGGSPVGLNLLVPDVDAVWARAIAAGADGLRPPADQPYGERSSTFVDPFGHRWMVQTTIAHPTHAEIDAAMDGFSVVEPEPGT